MAREPQFAPQLLAVPGDVETLRTELDGLGVVGWAVDGASLGHDGWSIALVAGDEADRVWLLRDGEAETLDLDDLTGRLADTWPDAVAGEPAVERIGASNPVPVSTSFPASTVGVTPPADLMLGTISAGTGVEMHEARVGDRILVGAELDPAQVPDDMLTRALAGAKGVTVALWRRGPVTGLAVLRRGVVRAEHWWAPAWLPIGDELVDDLRAEMHPPVGDAAEIGRLLDLTPSEVVSLRAMMRRSEPDSAALVELLGLPDEVSDVLDRRTTVADLPGGSVAQPRSWREEMKRSLHAGEHDPRWMQGLDAGARDLTLWYLWWSAATVVAGAVLVWRAGTVASFWGVVGLALVLMTVLDVGVRFVRKRRRSAE